MRTPQDADAWLRDRGEGALNAAGTAFMWGAALHAAYVMAVPPPLRPAVARRNARAAMVRRARGAARHHSAGPGRPSSLGLPSPQHAALIALRPTPAPSRPPPFRPRQLASLTALAGVAAYDQAQQSRLGAERARLAADYRRLTAAAAAAEGGLGGGGGGGGAAAAVPEDEV
jgi:hypothetical protein